ncbi:hypothetical protein SKAU_G00150320 [Synaphobranchus kaupii]|uniref:Uncharacterized protein n=1 Tax=Synaphobranchus kaupii TaxID=118154 RepID=A0A9Q1J4V9_SYNKA|nr:hypothetical protein SKAU_G00150320 [Synaphobranchus kaupii]
MSAARVGARRHCCVRFALREKEGKLVEMSRLDFSRKLLNGVLGFVPGGELAGTGVDQRASREQEVSEGEVASQSFQLEGDEAEVGEEGIDFQSLFKESDSEAASMVTVESGSEEECAMEREVEGGPVKRMAEDGIDSARTVKGKKSRAGVRERWDLMGNISDSEESGSSPRYQADSPNRVPFVSEISSPPDEPPFGGLRRGAGRKKK